MIKVYLIRYVFGLPLFPEKEEKFTEEEEILAMEVMEKWASFAKYGYVY